MLINYVVRGGLKKVAVGECLLFLSPISVLRDDGQNKERAVLRFCKQTSEQADNQAVKQSSSQLVKQCEVD